MNYLIHFCLLPTHNVVALNTSVDVSGTPDMEVHSFHFDKETFALKKKIIKQESYRLGTT